MSSLEHGVQPLGSVVVGSVAVTGSLVGPIVVAAEVAAEVAFSFCAAILLLELVCLQQPILVLSSGSKT